MPISTTGLTALVAGEGWHYVGEAGEPAFENGWVNVSGVGKLAFRVRESGVVDIYGGVDSGTPGAAIFTLPTGYRPSVETGVPSTAYSDLTPPTISVFPLGGVTTAGVVTGPPDAVSVVFTGQFFLTPPDLAP